VTGRRRDDGTEQAYAQQWRHFPAKILFDQSKRKIDSGGHPG
jgi:hypothetical protein